MKNYVIRYPSYHHKSIQFQISTPIIKNETNIISAMRYHINRIVYNW
jgi:hypothetical protein